MKKSILIILIINTFFSPKNINAQSTFVTEKTDVLVKNFCNITNASQWNLITTIKLNFCTYHPQGMVKIGDLFYLSSVQKIIPPKKLETSQNGFDRSTGKGIGHLFKFDIKGDLISKITLGDSIIHHPGGIDFDAAKPDGMPRKLLDVSRLTALGWKPQFTLEEGIRAAYASYLEGVC